jgi:hypothetical protein
MMQQEADQWQQNLEDLPQSVWDAITSSRAASLHLCLPPTESVVLLLDSEVELNSGQSPRRAEHPPAASSTTVSHLIRSLRSATSAIDAVKRVRYSPTAGSYLLPTSSQVTGSKTALRTRIPPPPIPSDSSVSPVSLEVSSRPSKRHRLARGLLEGRCSRQMEVSLELFLISESSVISKDLY